MKPVLRVTQASNNTKPHYSEGLLESLNWAWLLLKISLPNSFNQVRFWKAFHLWGKFAGVNSLGANTLLGETTGFQTNHCRRFAMNLKFLYATKELKGNETYGEWLVCVNSMSASYSPWKWMDNLNLLLGIL